MHYIYRIETILKNGRNKIERLNLFLYNNKEHQDDMHKVQQSGTQQEDVQVGTGIDREKGVYNLLRKHHMRRGKNEVRTPILLRLLC